MKLAACQLLTAIDDGEKAATILLDPNYAVQQKFDGKRIVLQIERTQITAHNREGVVCSISPEILREAKSLAQFAPLTLDGEWIREAKSFQTFDLLELGGNNTRDLAFRVRQSHLQQLVPANAFTTIQAARTEYETPGKVQLLQQVHDANLEGIVLKHVDSPYRTDRQADQFKHRFSAVSSFLITKMNPKQSVAIGLYDENGKLIQCGDVKIRNDRFKLAEGIIIDVRYNHMFPTSLRVYHPRMERIRDDLQPESCTLSQVRYKGTKTAIII